MSELAWAVLLPCAAAALITPACMQAARRLGALDHPSADKLHPVPTPTLGGLAVMAAVLGSLLLLAGTTVGLPWSAVQVIAAAAAPLVLVGVLDDLRPLPAGLRLVVHLAAGVILYQGGLRITTLTNPFGADVALGAFGVVVTALWVAAVINALNLMDGLDGLSAGTGGIAALSLAVVGLARGEQELAALGLILAGAVAGFLPYNFPRARVFLGDVGSTFIGLILAVGSLLENRKTTASMTLLLPLVALGLPLLDTLVAVVRRVAHGRSPLRRDLDHLHHRLLRLGLSPTRATGVLLAATAVLGTTAVLLANLPKQTALLVTAVWMAGGLGALGFLSRSRRGLAASRPRPAPLVASARSGEAA